MFSRPIAGGNGHLVLCHLVQCAKLDFIIRITKPRWQALQHLNLCLSAHPLYLLHCPNMGVPVFNWLCLSDLPPIIYYHTWSSLIVAYSLISPFFIKDIQPPSKQKVSPLPSTKDLGSVPRRHTSKLPTCFCHILGRQPKFIWLFKFINCFLIFPIY